MQPTEQLQSRVQSVDILRGIVMIIMALDHVRDYFHNGAFTGNPLDPLTTTPLLYFTRWITHFCAPTFVFLAGTSAYLSGLRKSKKQLSSFLIKRGLWLMFIEIAVMSLVLTFNPFYNFILLQVIWAIGLSMVFLGLLIWLPFRALLIIGLLIVLLHNVLDYIPAAINNNTNFLWDIVHARFAMYTIAEGHVVAITYSFLPWLGIMIMGYCLGKLFDPSTAADVRKRRLLIYGFSMIILFIILRLINYYGDPIPWQKHPTRLASFLSFMNVNKYPPSLLFICITLGPALIVLALIEKIKNRATEFVKVYGQVPFFYFVVHFFIIHALVVIAFFLTGYGYDDITVPKSPIPFWFRPPEFGFDLWAVYLIWIAVVLILYPMCKWYSRYKRTHRHWWLRYV